MPEVLPSIHIETPSGVHIRITRKTNTKQSWYEFEQVAIAGKGFAPIVGSYRWSLVDLGHVGRALIDLHNKEKR